MSPHSNPSSDALQSKNFFSLNLPALKKPRCRRCVFLFQCATERVDRRSSRPSHRCRVTTPATCALCQDQVRYQCSVQDQTPGSTYHAGLPYTSDAADDLTR